MKAVILAAGRGSRLGPRSGPGPKALLEVGGRTLLARQFDALARIGVHPEDVTVVGGYGWRELKASLPSGACLVVNRRWRTTDTLGSLLSADPGADDLLIVHGDLALDPRLLVRTLEECGDVVVPVDTESADAEAMKVRVRHGTVEEMGKGIPLSESSGESMGIFLVRSAAVDAFLASAATLAEESPEAVVDDAVLMVARHSGLRVSAADVTGIPWEEIDTPDDLKRAQAIFERRDDAANAWDRVWNARRKSRGDRLTSRLGRRLARRGDLGRLVLEELERTGRFHSGARILEAGCGSGAVLRRVFDRAKSAAGFDLSPNAARLSAEEGLRVFLGDIRHIPCRPGGFDLVYSVGVLDQLKDEDLERALDELLRVVAENGKLLLIVASARSKFHEEVKRRLLSGNRWPFGQKRAFHSLANRVRRVSPACIVRESHRGWLLQYRAFAYLFWHLGPLRRIYHALFLLANRLLWRLNKLPGMVLVTEVELPGKRGDEESDGV